MIDLPRGHHVGRGLILAALVAGTAVLVYLVVRFDVPLLLQQGFENVLTRVRRAGPFG